VSRVVRRLALAGAILPSLRWSMRLQVDGLDHLSAPTGPVIFAANHQSHMDTPAIYTAMPAAVRNRVAPAMAREFFAEYFGMTPAPWYRRVVSGAAFYLACQCFNAFPLPQRQSPRAAFRYMRELVDEGYSILIYPEGERVDGPIRPFRRGVGTVAIHLQLPVVPIRIDGLDYVFPRKARIPRRGPVRIAFGAPLLAGDDDAAVFTERIEAAVREL
jgi:long-chain acyl-CoA synthetase